MNAKQVSSLGVAIALIVGISFFGCAALEKRRLDSSKPERIRAFWSAANAFRSRLERTKEFSTAILKWEEPVLRSGCIYVIAEGVSNKERLRELILTTCDSSDSLIYAPQTNWFTPRKKRNAVSVVFIDSWANSPWSSNAQAQTQNVMRVEMYRGEHDGLRESGSGCDK